MTTVLTTKATAEDLLKLSGEEGRYELVEGEIVDMGASGARHGGIGTRLARRLGNWVEEHQLGEVYTPDTGFEIGENVRIPDVAFVSAVRIPETGEPMGFWPFAPDLAVEVISPSDIYEDVMVKLAEYFAAGTRHVWLMSIKARTVSVYRSLTAVTVFGENDELEAEDLFPGFRCRVSDLFKQPVARSQ
jgi:Uma2 family endonuclease